MGRGCEGERVEIYKTLSHSGICVLFFKITYLQFLCLVPFQSEFCLMEKTVRDFLNKDPETLRYTGKEIKQRLFLCVQRILVVLTLSLLAVTTFFVLWWSFRPLIFCCIFQTKFCHVPTTQSFDKLINEKMSCSKGGKEDENAFMH